MTDERRIVTILFADVADSTALGEALDPEDLLALLARYYAIGLRDGDLEQLETAMQVADACGAAALLARVRYEVALARRDEAGMDAAIRALEAMGDRAQIARYRGRADAA